MGLDRVRGVEGGQGTGHHGGIQRLCVQPPCSPTCPAPLNTVGGGGSWTWQVCPSPQEALLEGPAIPSTSSSSMRLRDMKTPNRKNEGLAQRP